MRTVHSVLSLMREQKVKMYIAYFYKYVVLINGNTHGRHWSFFDHHEHFP